jgi:glucose-1-phosphate thymidylyltransferase
MIKKGIVLAGGAGSRLYPLTLVTSKQLQPVYDKPMIYYPISTLMAAGIRDILLISSPLDVQNFQKLLGDGSTWGISIKYAVQHEPKGIAHALLVAENFIMQQPVALILGDNIFYGNMQLSKLVCDFKDGAMIFGHPVRDPERYGVAEFDDSGRVISLVEKPKHPRSNLAVTGLYLYDSTCVERTRNLRPSERGELEITDLNIDYLNAGQLQAHSLGRGIAWLDTGTHESLLEASNFIEIIEKRQGLKIACLEETALTQGFISSADLAQTVKSMPRSPYRDYCEKLKP